MEALGKAETTKEINAAVRSLYPQKEISDLLKGYRDDHRQNENVDWEESLKKFRQDVKGLLDQFTETVLSRADGRPEVILAGYNNLGAAFGRLYDTGPDQDQSFINPEDEAAYKEVYRSQALDAIRNKLAGLSEEERDRELIKYYNHDASGLLSSERDGKWYREVEALVTSE